jgi:hypothetical protein
MTTPFVIFALPRSRTAWLSRFLTYGPWHCGHEELRHCRSLDDVNSWFAQPFIGSVETAGAFFWRLLPPNARVVTIRRPVHEVIPSLAKAGLAFDEPVMRRQIEHLDRKLDQVERRISGVLRVEFDALGDEGTCAQLFERCLELPFDQVWHDALSPVNIQINLPRLFLYYQAHRPQIEKLAKTAKHRMLRTLLPEPAEPEGVTFQTEPFYPAFDDAKPLFAEHLVQTGQSPDDYLRKNVALCERLYDTGHLHTFTARSNGRMFAYLVSVIAPSLDSPDETLAEQTIFFADPNFPGLGMKLQKAAIADLKARGVNRILMRAGHRGSGPRLGTLFRRLGAESFGNLYSLPLEAA